MKQIYNRTFKASPSIKLLQCSSLFYVIIVQIKFIINLIYGYVHQFETLSYLEST